MLMKGVVLGKNLAGREDWVRETRFGRWFLRSDTWFRYVLSVAIQNMRNLVGDDIPLSPLLLDVGCGEGRSFSLLDTQFRPRKIIGVDIDQELLRFAQVAANICPCDVELINTDVATLNLPDNTVDIICCHQLLHHVAHQEQVLKELYRVLKPGGFLMVNESCRVFIESWTVRYLFKHPDQVQKSADEYVALIKGIGFQVNPEQVKSYSPWWSLKDLGLRAKLGLSAPIDKASEVLLLASK